MSNVLTDYSVSSDDTVAILMFESDDSLGSVGYEITI